MDRTLQVLFSAPRPGFKGKPDTEVRLTLESFEGKRYAAWGAYRPEATRAQNVVSIRRGELGGVVAALQQAADLWERADDTFLGTLTHAEYAATLDWT